MMAIVNTVAFTVSCIRAWRVIIVCSRDRRGVLTVAILFSS